MLSQFFVILRCQCHHLVNAQFRFEGERDNIEYDEEILRGLDNELHC